VLNFISSFLADIHADERKQVAVGAAVAACLLYGTMQVTEDPTEDLVVKAEDTQDSVAIKEKTPHQKSRAPASNKSNAIKGYDYHPAIQAREDYPEASTEEKQNPISAPERIAKSALRYMGFNPPTKNKKVARVKVNKNNDNAEPDSSSNSLDDVDSTFVGGSSTTGATEASSSSSTVSTGTTTTTTPTVTPTITSISPTSGPAAGNTTLTINGTNFENGLTVSLDSTACATVVFISSSQVTCTTAYHTAASVNVTVTNPSGEIALLASAYSYYANPSANFIVSVGAKSLGAYGYTYSTGVSAGQKTFVIQADSN